MPATQYTNEYRFEARHFTSSKWEPITEEFVCNALSIDTPDPRELNDILIEMRKGAEADDGTLVFRAVPVPRQAELRVVYTTAPVEYDGFGTVTLVEKAGTDRRGMVVRKVGIRPEHYEWQVGRYGSGTHLAIIEAEIKRFAYVADIWTMTE